MGKTFMEDKPQPEVGLDAALVIAYAKDRYDEVKASYRRLEDKANFLLAVLGVETSALLAISGSAWISNSIENNAFTKIMIISFFFCFICIAMCFYNLWHSWRLRNIPRMPIHRKENEHDFYFTGQKKYIIKYYLMMYARVSDEIEKLHKEKTRYVNNVFEWMATSFILFICSVICMLLSKV